MTEWRIALDTYRFTVRAAEHSQYPDPSLIQALQSLSCDSDLILRSAQRFGPDF